MKRGKKLTAKEKKQCKEIMEALKNPEDVLTLERLEAIAQCLFETYQNERLES